MLDEVQQQHQHSSFPILRITLIAAIVIMFGVWLYVGPLSPEPGTSLRGQPRAANVYPCRFVLWELHADDTVRVVELITEPSVDSGMPYPANGQSLRSGDKVLSTKWIGGELEYQNTADDVYHGTTYLRTQYWLKVTDNQYGYDMRINHPPHLHISDETRLISIGVDPKAFAQEIVTVAIPVSARLRRIYDYQPYHHVTLDEWDVFYYDLSGIQGHISIHIQYVPGDDASSLDWAEVEAGR